MELEDFKEEWNQSEKKRNEFSESQLKANSVIDNLVKTQMIQFGKLLLISLGIMIIGTVFLGPSQTEGFLSMFVLVISCVVLTIPICLIFLRTIKMIKSLDVSTGVADSLRNYRHRIESEIRVQKLMIVLVILMLLGFSFIAPSVFKNGFEIASIAGIYTLVLLGYSYGNFQNNLKNELLKLSKQLEAFELN